MQPPAIRALFLAADPTDQGRVRVGEEIREIHTQLCQQARLRDRFVLTQRFAVRPQDISQALLEIQPELVHFSGHGQKSGALCVEGSEGKTLPIMPEALGALFKLAARSVKAVVLNACYTEAQARAIVAHIPVVIGMQREISDSAAIRFAVGFYQAFGAGESLCSAYEYGCVQIQLAGKGSEHLTPVLLQRSPHVPLP